MLNFLDLYEGYAAEVYRFAIWLSGDIFDAEDITSETFIRAWAHNNTIRTETFKAYLFTIARNVYLLQRRKRKNQLPLHDDVHDPAPGPEKVIESQFEIQRVRSVLQSLQEIDRSVLILRVQHELPYAEIARILGISFTTAKVKVHRVRKKLLLTGGDMEVD